MLLKGRRKLKRVLITDRIGDGSYCIVGQIEHHSAVFHADCAQIFVWRQPVFFFKEGAQVIRMDVESRSHIPDFQRFVVAGAQIGFGFGCEIVFVCGLWCACCLCF